ncbi:MAG: 3-methyl-2-oxobutanoate dehydrogenase subunit VorB [Eubacteriaceae bacterium]|nr:3-methyl-2-oxobutanoate dehydrogenase subunit VorB [Eubacteriaceae bacterium]
MSKQLMKGCEAVAEAAVRAGCRFFAGYPITPQNEIPEYMSSRLPEVGGTFVQGESEIASINMVYGASATGTRAMTSSSSPGISLKTEGISYLAGALLPAVIVNVSRGGPGLGSIQPAQSDYLQATKAPGHGGFHTLVFAPSTLQEAVDLTYEAFDYAERDRCPVMILMDGCLGSIMESVSLPAMKDPAEFEEKKWAVGYNGQSRPTRIITSIYPELVLENNNKARVETYARWAKEDAKAEELLLDDAQYVVVAYGIAARIAKQAVLALRAKGIKIGMIRPITLYPFPKQSFAKLNSANVKAIIDIEMTIPAQMEEDIALATHCAIPIHSYGRSGGNLLDDDGVRQAIEKIVGGEA